MFDSTATPTVILCTIADNVCALDSSGTTVYCGAGSAVRLQNTIVASNLGSGVHCQSGGVATLTSYCQELCLTS